jgi:hypothetical protein
MSRVSLFLVFLVLLISLVSCDVYLHHPRGSNNRFREQTGTRQSNNRLFDSQNNNRGGYNIGERNSHPADQAPTVKMMVESSNGLDFSSVAFGTGATAGTQITNIFHPFRRVPRTPVIALDSDQEPNALYANVYLEGSELQIDWTNQHGCGGNAHNDSQKVNCQMILQYMCERNPSYPINKRGGSDSAYPISPGDERGITDGVIISNNNINALDNNRGILPTDVNNDQSGQYGYHESFSYATNCRIRQRNAGLFTADQNMAGYSADYSRQNPDGDDSGTECAEERDYYPYWAPTPWRDIAVLTDQYINPDVCPYYQNRSQNVADKGACGGGSLAGQALEAAFNKDDQTKLYPLTQQECEGTTFKGTWSTHKWNLPPPECKPAPWTRDNHLGNGRDGELVGYTWKLPTVAQLTGSGAHSYADDSSPGAAQYVKCVLRLRYNISTDDYNPSPDLKGTGAPIVDYRYNSDGNPARNRNQDNFIAQDPLTSPFQEPEVNANSYYAYINGRGFDPTNVRNADENSKAPNNRKWLESTGKLRMNMNTNQYFRTFEDRSHTFYIRTRPSTIPASDRVVNLSVKGKRCNIVQCYPAVEYDFTPRHLNVTSADWVHVQWTGSNSHQNNPQNSNSGDGQGGDAGQGREGSDRNNIAQLDDYGLNYPIPLDKYVDNMWSRSSCYHINGQPLAGTLHNLPGTNRTYGDITTDPAAVNCAIHLATSGYFGSRTEVRDTIHHMQPILNDAPASLVGGVIMQFDGVGQEPLASGQTVLDDAVTFKYLCTRNNQYTNRGQKGTIRVTPAAPLVR